MAEELTRALVRRAERGDPRGAWEVLAVGRHLAGVVGGRRVRWRTGPMFAVAVAAVTLFVVGGALLATRLLVADPSPISPVASSVTVPPVPTDAPQTRLFTIEGPADRTAAVAWSPDGAHLATAINGTAMVWEASTGKQVAEQHIDHIAGVSTIAWSPEGTTLALAAGSDTGIYDPLAGPRPLVLLPEFLAWSPDGSRVVSGGAWGWAAIIDAATGEKLLTLEPGCPGPSSWVSDADWSPDGTRVATTCAASIRIWDSSTGTELFTIESDIKVTDVAWSPDGTRIAAASDQATAVTVWDAATGEALTTLVGHDGENGGVWALGWNPDGTRIATAGADWTAKIWDPATGNELATFTGHTAAVTGLAWSPDGARIATAGRDGTVTIWLAT